MSDQGVAEIGFQLEFILGLGTVEVQRPRPSDDVDLLLLRQQGLDIEPGLQHALAQLIFKLAQLSCQPVDIGLCPCHFGIATVAVI